MTLGLSVIRRQFNAIPPTGVIALSISAAVVPWTKFFAITMYGPAIPRMVIPGLDGVTTLNWVFSAGDEAEAWMAEWSRFAWSGRNDFLLACRGRGAAGLLCEWRSCVHSASTLPAGRPFCCLGFLPTGLVEVETLLCKQNQQSFAKGRAAVCTFVIPLPILLARDGPVPGLRFAFPGALDLRPLPNISRARASFLRRWRSTRVSAALCLASRVYPYLRWSSRWSHRRLLVFLEPW